MNTSTDFSSIISSGKPVKIIRAELTLAGATNKQIKELTAGMVSKEGWTYTNTLDFLESDLRTQKDLYTAVLENSAVNEARWIGDRERVRLLVIKIAQKLGAEFTEELASKELVDAVKALSKQATKKTEVSSEPGLGLELGASDMPIVEEIELESPKAGKKAKKG